MLKGWIDRVISYGWAWIDPMRPELSPMKARKILVLVTAGANQQAFIKRGYDASLHTQLNVGTWDYCGFNDVTTRIFYEVHDESSPEQLQNYLIEARELCIRFAENH